MPLSVSDRLGPYEVIAPIGAGGMGEVYRARDTRLNREVAIKMSLEHFSDRFEREARSIAALNHPNICTLYDVGPNYLVMELVEGPTLADRIKQGPLPLDEALAIARGIAEALEAAHEKGIVHRDLKPGNVKIKPDGAVKVLDFGLAKMGEASIGEASPESSPTLTFQQGTRAGMILGTAAYMAPEQARGKPVDRRADIWAFGSVLYETITGKRVYEGETVSDILAAVIMKEPDWNAVPASTPMLVRRLLRRCLEKDPKRRLQAIGEARITLEEVLAGKGDEDIDETGNAKTAAVPQKQRFPVAVALGAFLAGVLLAGVGAFWAARPGSALADMHFSAVTSFAGVQAQPALSPDGRSVAFVSNRDGHYNIYVGLVRGGELVEVTHGESLKSRPSWSPDGSTLAYAELNDSGLMDVWEVPALGGVPRMVVPNANDPTWMPDGRSLVYEKADGMVWTCGASGENPRLMVRMSSFGWATDLRVSPDGKMLAIAVRGPGPYGELGVADLSNAKVRLLTKDHALALSPAWSADSRNIYFASSRGGTLNVWKIDADGNGLRQITAGEGDDAELDVSSDGKRLVFATLRSNVGLAQMDFEARPESPSIRVLASDPARNEYGPVYSPDGAHIVFFTNLKGIENESIGVADASGGNASQLLRDGRIDVFPRWMPDGNRVVYSSQDRVGGVEAEYRSVAISGGAPETILRGSSGVFDIGGDGRLLYQSSAGDVQAFDPRQGKTLTLGRIPNAGRLRWSPDGSFVAYQLAARRKDDPDAGIWVTDFKTIPRQVFRGWAAALMVDAHDDIFFLKGKDDLNGELWKVKWDGSGLTRIPGTIPLLYDGNYFHSSAGNQPDVSPDGRHIVFQSHQVLQENIGIIDNLR